LKRKRGKFNDPKKQRRKIIAIKEPGSKGGKGKKGWKGKRTLVFKRHIKPYKVLHVNATDLKKANRGGENWQSAWGVHIDAKGPRENARRRHTEYPWKGKRRGGKNESNLWHHS